MLIDIDFAFHSAEFPEGGVRALVGKSQFAPSINNAPDDHGQGRTHPRLLTGIEDLREFEFPSQLKQSVAGPILARGENLEGLRRIDRQDLATEGGLQQFEFFERESGNAAVIAVLDLAVQAEGGADEAVMVFALGLDFQMEIGGGIHGVGL